MRCPSCAEEIRDSAKVCGYCGTRLVPPLTAVPELESEVAAPAVVPERGAPEPVPEPELVPEPEPVPEPVAEPESVVADGSTAQRRFKPVLALSGLAAAVAIAVILIVVLGGGSDVTQDTAGAITTNAPTTSVAPAGTVANPTTPTLATVPERHFRGAPILSVDDLVHPRLNLLPGPDAFTQSTDGTYLCAAYDQIEGPDGEVTDLFQCAGSFSSHDSDVLVIHGFERNPGESLEEALDFGDTTFQLCLDDCLGGMQNLLDPIAFLEYTSEGSPAASFVYFLSLTGEHTLVAMWWDRGMPIVTSVTEVHFP